MHFVYNFSEQTSSLQRPWGSVSFAESCKPFLNLLRCLYRNLVKCKYKCLLKCVLFKNPITILLYIVNMYTFVCYTWMANYCFTLLPAFFQISLPKMYRDYLKSKYKFYFTVSILIFIIRVIFSNITFVDLIQKRKI